MIRSPNLLLCVLEWLIIQIRLFSVKLVNYVKLSILFFAVDTKPSKKYLSLPALEYSEPPDNTNIIFGRNSRSFTSKPSSCIYLHIDQVQTDHSPKVLKWYSLSWSKPYSKRSKNPWPQRTTYLSRHKGQWPRKIHSAHHRLHLRLNLQKPHELEFP